LTAAIVAGAVSCGLQLRSNQRPPNVLITVVNGAPNSPHPGRARRQMPYWFFERLFSFAA
jgi:hypothetical protein